MSELCISTYATILRREIGYSNEEDIYSLLFDWAIIKWKIPQQRKGNSELIHFAAKDASNLKKRKKDLDNSLKDFIKNRDNYVYIKEHFSEYVIPKFQTDKNTMYHNYMMLIEEDKGMSTKDKDTFRKLYAHLEEDDNASEFLSYLFVLAVGRVNTLLECNPDDVKYLIEVNGRCPICGKELRYSEKRSEINYKIIQIYPQMITSELPWNDELPEEFTEIEHPTNPEDPSNLIAVHKSVAGSYETFPTYKIYLALKKKKEEINRIHGKLDAAAILKESVILSEQLDLVIKELPNLKESFVASDILKMKPYKVEDKVEDELLLGEVKDAVIQYRDKIRFLLIRYEKEGKLNTKKVMCIMRQAYLSIKDFYDDNQADLFDSIAEWIARSLPLGDRYLWVCRLLVAFFVQNCEVFDVIP